MKKRSSADLYDDDDEVVEEYDSQLEDEEEEEDDDAQRPRYAAYHGESDDDDEDDDGEDDEDDDQDRERALQQELGSLPLSVLVKAQVALDGGRKSSRRKAGGSSAFAAEDDGEEDDEQDEDDGPQLDDEDSDDDGPPQERTFKQRKEIAKRADKSAPTEMSSKRAVTRKRQVIDVPKNNARDPRFGSLSTSSFNTGLFSNSYNFINQAQSTELSTLRKSYSQLRKAVAQRAPSDEKAARGGYSAEAMELRAERDRVGRQIKRLESMAAEKERRDREAEVKRNLRKVNEERQRKGQEPVFLKRAQMKGVMLQDKFERLSSQGNKNEKNNPNNTPLATSSSSSSNMSVDRLKAMIKTGYHSVPTTASTLAGHESSSAGGGESRANAAVRKIMVRKAKKEAAKDRRDMPFLIRDRGGGKGNTGAGVGAGGEGGDAVGAKKKRHRGSRGSGSASKRPRTQ
ncbi:hypothetical protein V8E36_008241 [Tilletia maclaganii]